MSTVGNNVYFTSDQHFLHRRIIQYCNRPWWRNPSQDPTWDDVIDMTGDLIRLWNSVVEPHDTVYCLGDFSLASPEKVAWIVRSLNGYKWLVMGNHDRQPGSRWAEAGFDEVVDETEYGGWLLVHKPIYVDKPIIKAFCGHVHDNWARINSTINVGVDCWDYRPRTINELVQATDLFERPTTTVLKHEVKIEREFCEVHTMVEQNESRTQHQR